MAKRYSKEERVYYGKMVADAHDICWKLQNDVPLTEDDERALVAMPMPVQIVIREVGEL